MREEALAQRSNGGPAPAAAEGGAAAAAPAPLPYAAPGLPPIAAVPQLWDALAALHGDAPALVDPHAHPPQQYSFAQVAALVRQLAAGLAGLGLCKGDAVVLFSENRRAREGGGWGPARRAGRCSACARRAAPAPPEGRPAPPLPALAGALRPPDPLSAVAGAAGAAGAAGVTPHPPTHPHFTPRTSHPRPPQPPTHPPPRSAKWLLADQAVQACGAADAVRGVASSLEELAFILGHSRASGLIVQDAAALDRLLPALAPAAGDAAAAAAAAVRWVVVLHGEPSAGARAALAARPLLSFEELAARGREGCGAWHAPELSGGDVATYIYTSGTSGQPKASAAALWGCINYLRYFIDVKAGRRTLSLLPPWHVYERSVAYYVLSSGVFTNIRKFREDLQAGAARGRERRAGQLRAAAAARARCKYPPDYFICVPLVLDTLYSKARVAWVIATLKKASALRRTLALGLLAAAAAYTRARRVVEGTALAHAAAPRPAAAMVAAWLRLALLAPLNWLAQVLVVAKVRAAIGIREAVISGGGSLAAHLDDFYESIGAPLNPKP
eukprot:scaffold17.g574.t1